MIPIKDAKDLQINSASVSAGGEERGAPGTREERRDVPRDE